MKAVAYRIRAVAFFLVFVLSLIVFVPLLLLSLPLPARQRIGFSNLWFRFTAWSLRVIGGIRVQFSGMENLPPGPAIYLVKHQSTLETFVLQPRLPLFVWVVKKQLLQIPVFGWGLAVIKPIAIDRNAGSSAVAQVVEQGCDRLAEGLGVLLFPEGTRSAPGEQRRYKLGGGLLAEAAKHYPVVPIAHNAGFFWPPKRALLGRPGVAEFTIGAPIEPKGLSAQEIVDRAREWIERESERLAQAPRFAPR